MKKLMIALSMVSMVAAGEEAKKDAPPPLPPEVKKTVDAMMGTWTFEGTVTGMSKEPMKVKEPYVCKKAAGGRAVYCNGKAKLPGLGAVEDESLVTWDVEAKVMRFIGVSSMGDVHDHRCTWKDDKNVSCEPLELPSGTVDLVMSWPDAKTMTMTETTTLKDGTKVVFDGKAKR